MSEVLKDEKGETILLTCDCHVPLHFIKFTVNDERPNEIFVTYCSEANESIWKRIKRSFQYILGKDDLVIGEVCLQSHQLIDLGKTVEKIAVKYLEEG